MQERLGITLRKNMKKPLSDSSFNKWRCLIALAHVDSKLQPTERDFISRKLRSLEEEYLTEEHMEILLKDLKNQQDPEEFFEEIESENDKIELLRLSYQLFWVDGEFDDREKKAFDTIKTALADLLKVDRFILDDIARLTGSESEVRQTIARIVQENKNPLKKH